MTNDGDAQMTLGAAPSDITIKPIADWLYCLHTPVVSAYAISQSTGFILVDAGVVGHEHGYLRALAEVADVPPKDVRITEIILTHGHDDHTGSAAALKAVTGAKISGPALDADVIEGRAAGVGPRLRDWEIPLFEKFGHVAPAPPVTLDVRVGDGDQRGWERPGKIVAAPGHTAGSIAIFLPEDHVLIAGDAIATTGGEPTPGVFNVDPEQARDSFQALARLDASILCVGHGPVIRGFPRREAAGRRRRGPLPRASLPEDVWVADTPRRTERELVHVFDLEAGGPDGGDRVASAVAATADQGP